MIKEQNISLSDLLRNFFARKPKEVDGVANTSAMYYRRKLLRLIFQRFEFLNMPKTWEFDYFLEHLFLDGVICVTDTEAGVLALKCGLTGIGIFEQPTQVIIANPVLGNFRRIIGEDCEIIKLQYNYQGVSQILDRYSVLLAMCDSSIAVNLMNTKIPYIFGATSKTQAETYKALYDDVAQGKPAVFTSNNTVGNIKENMFVMPAKQNFISDDVQLLKRKIINEFLTDIGINNTNLDKRERLTDDEVNANNDEVLANISHWYDNISDGIKRVNERYNLNIEFKIREYGREEAVNELSKSSRLLSVETD